MSQPAALSEGAQRIVQAATPLFAAKGFSGVSITDIANAVGGSKANIFHHFPNKKSLYLASIRSACQTLRSEFERISAAHRDGCDPLSVLAGLRLQQMFDEPDPVRLILREVFVGEKGIDRSLVAEILHRNFAQFVDEIRAEQRQGRFRGDVDPVLVAVTITALNNFYFQAWSLLERFEEFTAYGSAQACAAATFDTLSKGLTKP